MLEKPIAYELAALDPPPAVKPALNTSNKRRRDDQSESESEFEYFQILPYPRSRLDKPINVTGQLTVPRALLPLFFLDPTRSTSVLRNKRFFSSYIKSLEEIPTTTAASQWYLEYGSPILIAKLECEEALFAIERTGASLYAICTLAYWVNLESLRSLTHHKPPSLPYSISVPEPLPMKTSDDNEWWASMVFPEGDAPQSKRRKLDSSLGNVETSESLALNSNAAQLIPVAQANDPEPTFVPAEAVPIQQQLEDVPRNLTGQYLNALYISNTSLAYFAKGPLSRARATFNAENTLTELLNFLNSLVLTVSTADKKYKTTIPDIVNSSVMSSGKGAHKLKKKAKTAPDKNGLFPDEANFIKTWWETNSSQAQLSECVSHIRFRETLLQLTLVFEILALHATVSATDGGIEAAQTAKKSKTLQKHIDVLVDRLTIWHSIEAGDDISKSVKYKDQAVVGNMSKSGQSSDQLKEFCLEVAIPFYNARIPGTVERLTTKLGAPIGVSPTRRINDERNLSRNVPPGTELTRQKPSNAKSEIRSANELSAAKVAPLVRSKSDSTSTKKVDEVKSSGPLHKQRRPLSRSQSINQSMKTQNSHSRSNSIVQPKIGNRPSSRSSSMSQTNNNLKQREVDFSAIGKFYQAKLKRKSEVEQELKDAISALKKPNRDLAGKEYMEAAHERVSSVKLQKPSLIPRRKGGAGVEVNATPKRLEKNSCVAATPDKDGSKLLSGYNTGVLSEPCIPGSTLHPPPFKDLQRAGQPLSINSSTPIRKGGSIFETPSLENKSTQSLQDSAQQSAGAVFQTPTKIGFLNSRRPEKASQPPPPRRPISSFEHDTDAMTTDSTELENSLPQQSIYESLGWDDLDELMY